MTGTETETGPGPETFSMYAYTLFGMAIKLTHSESLMEMPAPQGLLDYWEQNSIEVINHDHGNCF